VSILTSAASNILLNFIFAFTFTVISAEDEDVIVDNESGDERTCAFVGDVEVEFWLDVFRLFRHIVNRSR
jgi:hypothetical protein